LEMVIPVQNGSFFGQKGVIYLQKEPFLVTGGHFQFDILSFCPTVRHPDCL
jgi:hypothetical protein